MGGILPGHPRRCSQEYLRSSLNFSAADTNVKINRDPKVYFNSLGKR